MSNWIEQIRKQIEQGNREQRIMNEAKARGDDYGTRAYRGLHKCIPYFEDGKRKNGLQPKEKPIMKETRPRLTNRIE